MKNNLQRIYKKYFSSPLLLVALISFFAAGIILVHSSSTHIATVKLVPSPTPVSISVEPSVSPTTIPSTLEATSFPTAIPTTTSTPIPTQANAQNTQQTTQQVQMSISEPDGTNNFSIDYHSGQNPCSALNDAKNAGKIRSVTIKTYGPPLNSDYIQELNGYSDNWTFSLNGTSEPKGCSNYSLNSGDSVQWKYN